MSNASSGGSKSLGRGDLLAIVIGNVIGGGVVTMTGLAIGITGRSIILSYIICAIMVTIVALPQFFLSSTIRMNGGFYTQASMNALIKPTLNCDLIEPGRVRQPL